MRGTRERNHARPLAVPATGHSSEGAVNLVKAVITYPARQPCKPVVPQWEWLQWHCGVGRLRLRQGAHVGSVPDDLQRHGALHAFDDEWDAIESGQPLRNSSVGHPEQLRDLRLPLGAEDSNTEGQPRRQRLRVLVLQEVERE